MSAALSQLEHRMDARVTALESQVAKLERRRHSHWRDDAASQPTMASSASPRLVHDLSSTLERHGSGSIRFENLIGLDVMDSSSLYTCERKTELPALAPPPLRAVWPHRLSSPQEQPPATRQPLRSWTP